MELIMNTLTYKEVDSFLFNDIKQHQFMSGQPRELNKHDVDLVSGGGATPNMRDIMFRMMKDLFGPNSPSH
jgi:hypothetical protein